MRAHMNTWQAALSRCNKLPMAYPADHNETKGRFIGTTIQLLRAVDERTDSILRHGTGPGKN